MYFFEAKADFFIHYPKNMEIFIFGQCKIVLCIEIFFMCISFSLQPYRVRM
jgi:hypothetical protein